MSVSAAAALTPGAGRRRLLGRRAQLLAAASVSYNVVEAVIAISAGIVADSTQTLLCTYLSAALLVGLLLNATLGWTWADPLAGMVIAGVALREGLGAWRGDACCGPVAGPSPDAGADDAGEDGCCGR